MSEQLSILEFEKKLKELLRDSSWEVWEEWYFEEFEMYLQADGCLGARIGKKSIPCEGRDWDESLACIIAYIESHPEIADGFRLETAPNQ